MYINPIVVGVLGTLLVEAVALVLYALSVSNKNKKEK